MPRVPIIWPQKGVHQDTPFSSQPQGTTRDAQNVLTTEPTTGRPRGGQRPGLSKWNANQLNAGNKVSALAHVTADDRLVSYAAIDPATDTVVPTLQVLTEDLDLSFQLTVATTVNAFKGCLSGDVDAFGNVYLLNGRSAITKYNPTGTELFTLSLPAEDDQHLVRAIRVDSLGFIFAAVSGGDLTGTGLYRQAGNDATPRMFCYQQEPDNTFSQLWQIEPGAYVEQIYVQEDKLFTAQNDRRQQRSWIRVYRSITSPGGPQLEWEQEVSYPVNDIALNEASDVYFTSPTFSGRGVNPLSPITTWASVNWQFTSDLNDNEVIWSHYRADSITELDVSGDLDDNPNVLIWRDLSGNGRHLYPGYIGKNGGSETAPRLRRRGLAGHQEVVFDGTDQSMATLGSPAEGFQGSKSEIRGMLPFYSGGAFAFIGLFRLSQERAGGAGRCIFFQENGASGASNHALCQNRTSSGSLGGSFSSGEVSYFADTDTTGDGGAGGGGHLLEGAYDTDNDLALITVVWDGGVNPDNAGTGFTRSLFRVNGEPFDRCEGEGIEISDDSNLGTNTFLGRDPNGTLDNMMGSAIEMVVLARINDDSTSEPIILDHPKYPGASFSAPTSADITTLERLEGEIAHRYGVSHLLSAESSDYPHPYGLDPTDTGTNREQRQIGPPNRKGTPNETDPSQYGKLATTEGLVGKLSAGKGNLRWVVDAENDPTTPGGIGYAVESNSEGDIYTAGIQSNSAGAEALVRKIVDNGLTADPDSGWQDNPTTGSFRQWGYTHPRMAVDEFDNLYVPGHFGGSSSGGASPSTETLVVYDKDGTALINFPITATLGPQIGTANFLNAVLLDPRVPEYQATSPPNIVEYLTVCAEDSTYSAARFNLVEVTSETGSARSMTSLGVSGGNVYTFADTGSPATPTGGTGALDSTAQYIHAATIFEKAYLTDGMTTVVYDPVDDEVSTLEATSAGDVPPRCKLLEPWQGRLVLARDADNAALWHMSAIGDPTDFDFDPPLPNASSAISGALSRAGLCPDIINTMIPFSDDFLIFGCDSSIWLLRGNPNEGGRFDQVSRTIGMAFGRPWCIDDRDRIWFFGNKGGLFVMTPDGGIERPSQYRVDRALQDLVDLSTHYVQLAYDRRLEAVHVLVFPFGAGGTALQHWVYEIKWDAFYPVKFGSTDVQPTALLVVDGDDPGDRRILFGCEDSYVRLFDEDSDDDDGSNIDSFVLFGPYALEPAPEQEAIWTQLQVNLAGDQGGCRFQLFARNEPDSLRLPLVSEDLGPGRNPPNRRRVRGAYTWMRLRNAAASRWGFESAYIKGVPRGRVRLRLNQ